VLLVDDEPSVREVGKDVLEHLGFQVVLGSGGREAIEAFMTTPLDFVLAIVDLTMPDVSGVDVVRELLVIRPDLPVLLASGFSEEEGLARLTDLPVRGFLAKPFSIDMLQAKIRAALE
jgi:DNA-binding response OmpR family regulator